MPSWPTTLTSMFAAGYAVTQAQKVGLDSVVGSVSSTLSRVLPGDGASSSGRGAGELGVLQGEVDRLHKLLADVVKGQRGGPGGVTVLHAGDGGRSGWSYIVYPVVIGGTVYYVYHRVRHGASIADFFFVTKKTLLDFRTSVTQSFAEMYEAMRKHKEEFMARISAVGERQQQMMAKQNEMASQQNDMDHRLRAVDENVEDIRDSASAIQQHVGQLAAGVDRANQGIYLLCATVAEVTRRVGLESHKSTSMLQTYVQAGPAELEAPGGGLRALLPEPPANGAGAASSASPSSRPQIVDVTGEVAAGPTSLASYASAPPETAVLYRRDSAAASSRGLWAGILGGAPVVPRNVVSNGVS